jgi:hypothetical protein
MNITKLEKPGIPEYVIQPNLISQAIYNLGPYARKLVAMAMSLMSPEKGVYKVSFSAADFVEAIGLEVRKQGTPTKEYIRAAVRECLDSHIEINKPNGDWKGYTWFTSSELKDFSPDRDCGWDEIEMNFNPDLGETIKAFKKAYAKISLADLGKLQSRYAIRFYELALSYAGFAGKDGNRPGEWYFDKTLDDLRILFGIGSKKYKATRDFRVKVIDNPIAEINGARLGLRIEPQYIRRGKWLLGARFACRFARRGDPVEVTPATETEQENSRLEAAFPEEFQKYFQEAVRDDPVIPGLFSEYFREEACRGTASERLRAAHPEFFKKTRKPAKAS